MKFQMHPKRKMKEILMNLVTMTPIAKVVMNQRKKMIKLIFIQL